MNIAKREGLELRERSARLDVEPGRSAAPQTAPAATGRRWLGRRLLGGLAMLMGAWSGLAGATTKAIAEPRETVTFTNVNSDGRPNSAANSIRRHTFTGEYRVSSIIFEATLRRQAEDSLAWESIILATAPDGTQFELSIDADYDDDGRATVRGEWFYPYVEPEILPEARGRWTFRFQEYYYDDGEGDVYDGNDPGIDAVWETVTITLDDEGELSTPPPAEDLGVIGETPVALTRPLEEEDALWFRFEVPAGVSAPAFLDISTSGSTLSGDPQGQDNDTVAVLFNSAGFQVAFNNDESAQSATSLLSFGAGSGGNSLGQNGDLAPGVYYLAIAAYESLIFDDFTVFPLSTATGTISLSLRTTRPCDCTPLAITQQPADASTGLFRPASFAVSFTGTEPEIRWQKDGRDIPGSNTRILTIASAQASDAGRYRAILTNCCSEATTRAASLTIQCPSDFNGDGFTDFFDYAAYVECFEGLDCPAEVTADFNGDGFVDFFDYADFLEEFEGNGRSFCSCLITEAPAGFEAPIDQIEPTSATLVWERGVACAQSYEIDRSDDRGATFRPFAVVDAATLSLTVTDLLPNSETRWRIRSCRFDGRSNACSPWSEPVLVVRTPCVELPAPGNVRVCNVWSTAVDVCWNDLAQGESGYIVEQSTDGVSFAPVATTEPNITRQRVTGLRSGQRYVFRVSTLVRSQYDSLNCITRGGTAAATPDCVRIPGGWHVVSTTSTSVCFLWTDTSSCETRFVIQQSVWDGSQWGPAEFGENVPPNRGDACRTGLSSATRYRFRIRAEIEGGRVSDWSDWREAHTGADCLQPPGNFRVASVAGNQICFLWSDTSSCEDRFVMEQSRWNGSSWDAWTFGENIPGNRGDACRTGLSYNTRYRFRVRAEIAGSRFSAWSEIVEATTGDDCLQTPSNFRVASVAGNQVCFLWNDTSSCEDRFVIEQSRWNGSAWEAWTFGENVPPNRGDACRTGLDYNTRYRFRIRAEIAGSRLSGWSPEVEVITPLDCLQSPSNFRITARGCGSITLAWTDTSSCETRFVIDQSRWNGSSWDGWVFGENVPPNATTAVRTNLNADGLYRFRIRAEIEGVRASDVTTNNPEGRATPSCLNRPTNLRIGAVTPTSVELLWNDNSSCETQFQIYERRFSSGAWQGWDLGENVPRDGERATRTELVRGARYQFYVIADQGSCESEWSNIVEVDLPN